MPKHIFRLVMLILAGLLVAVVAKALLTEESFYRFGHYRADSVPEVAALPVVYQGSASCQQCHAERYEKWLAAKHQSVSCETCHGPGQGHTKDNKLPIPDDSVKLCSTCHEAMPGRPAEQPQVELPKHGRGKQCVVCHNPHVPEE